MVANGNPFSYQGVSEYPPLAPLLVRPLLLDNLRDFVAATLDQSNAVFLLLYGPWGYGKSRLGHQLVCEALSVSSAGVPSWISVNRNGLRETASAVLQPDLGDHVLPLFTTFKAVIRRGINRRDVILKLAAQAALDFLSGVVSGRPSDPLQQAAVDAVRRRLNAERHDAFGAACGDTYDALASQMDNPDRLQHTLNKFRELLQEFARIKRILVLVDEIEDPSAVSELGGTSQLDPRLELTALFEGIKDTVNDQNLHDYSFVLLCTPRVKDFDPQPEAIARRKQVHVLDPVTLDDFYSYIAEVTAREYPDSLVRVAYLVSQGSFGVFHYVMHRFHRWYVDNPTVAVQFLVEKLVNQIDDNLLFRKETLQGVLTDDKRVGSNLVADLKTVILSLVPQAVSGLRLMTSLNDVLDYRMASGQPAAATLTRSSFSAQELATAVRLAAEADGALGSALLDDTKFKPGQLLEGLGLFGLGSGHFAVYDDFTQFKEFVIHTVDMDFGEDDLQLLHRVALGFPRGNEAYIGPSFDLLTLLIKNYQATTWFHPVSEAVLQKELSANYRTTVGLDERVCLGVGKVLLDNGTPQLFTLDVKSAYSGFILNRDSSYRLTRSSRLLVLYCRESQQAVEDIRSTASDAMPILLITPSSTIANDVLNALRNSSVRWAVMPIVMPERSAEYEFLLKYSFVGEQTIQVHARGASFRKQLLQQWEALRNHHLLEMENQGVLLKPVLWALTGGQQMRNMKTLADIWLQAVQRKDIALAKAENAAMFNQFDANKPNQAAIFDTDGRAILPPQARRAFELLLAEGSMTAHSLADRYLYAGFSDTYNGEVDRVMEQHLMLLESVQLVRRDGTAYTAATKTALKKDVTEARDNLDALRSSARYEPLEQKLTTGFLSRLLVNRDFLVDWDVKLKGLQTSVDGGHVRAPELPDELSAVHTLLCSVATGLEHVRRPSGGFQEPVTAGAWVELINALLNDTNLEQYGVIYRLAAADALRKAVEAETAKLLSRCQELRTQIPLRFGQVAGITFPCRIFTQYMDPIEKDLRHEELGTVPAEVQCPTSKPSIKSCLNTGDIEQMMQRLAHYDTLLGASTNSLMSRYSGLADAFTSIPSAFDHLETVWDNFHAYIAGSDTLAPDLAEWKKRNEDLSSACTEFEEWCNDISDLDGLHAEIEAVSAGITELESDVTAQQGALLSRIATSIATTKWSALEKLTAFKGIVPVNHPDQVAAHPTYHTQMEAARAFALAVDNEGVAMCSNKPTLWSCYGWFYTTISGHDNNVNDLMRHDETARKLRELDAAGLVRLTYDAEF